MSARQSLAFRTAIGAIMAGLVAVSPALAGGLSRGQLKDRLRNLAAKAPSSSGYYVYDLEAGRKRILFDRSEDKRRKLASNTKLFTTATALDRLGPEARIETTVKRRGNIGGAGVLNGRLYLIGGGDPVLGSSGTGDLASQVDRAGITRVTRGIVADDSIFDRRRGVPGTGYQASLYLAPLSGLVYGGSTYSGDPAAEAADRFRDALRARGIKVKGGIRVSKQPKSLRDDDPLATTSSDTIASIARATNLPSNNFLAEMLLKQLGTRGGKTGTTSRGAKVVERFARSNGSRINARDGSGLSEGNKASPRNVVGLLRAMDSRGKAGRAFYGSLARAGKEGTLDSRMEGTPAAKRCRGKTGTISGVSTLSGYCKVGGGKIAFSLLMNGVGSYDAARRVQDDMVVAIARYRR